MHRIRSFLQDSLFLELAFPLPCHGNLNQLGFFFFLVFLSNSRSEKLKRETCHKRFISESLNMKEQLNLCTAAMEALLPLTFSYSYSTFKKCI